MAEKLPVRIDAQETARSLAVPGGPRGLDVSARLQDVRGVLARRRWLIVGCAVVTALAGAFGTWRQTPIYQGEASLRIDEKRTNVAALDVLSQLQGTGIETEMQVLKSRGLATDVADTLGLRVEILAPRGLSQQQVFRGVHTVPDTTAAAPAPPGAAPGLAQRVAARLAGRFAGPGGYRLQREPGDTWALIDRTGGRRLRQVVPGDSIQLDGVRFLFLPGGAVGARVDFRVLSERDATNLVSNGLTVSRPVQEANLVRLTYENADPHTAENVPNALIALYLDRRQRIASGENEGTVKFLRDQIKKLSTSLAAQEDTLQRFRESQSVVSIEDQARSGVERLGELQAQRNQIDAERAALSTLLTDVHASAAKRGPGDPSPYRYLVAFPTLLKSGAASGLLQSLNEEEAKRADLLTRRTNADPDVMALTDRIGQLERQLDGVATTYYKGLQDQVAALDQTIGQSRSTLSSIPQKEITLGRLERQPKVLEGLYAMLQTRLKEAEIAAAATDPTAHLVDAAILPRVPVRPKPLVNITLAALVGLLLGVAAAFAREYADKNVHSRSEMMAATQAPVLGLIPRIPRSNGWAPLQAAVRHVMWLAPRQTDDISPDAASNGSPAAGQPDGGELTHPGIEAAEVMEAFNRLAVNIAFAQPAGGVRTLMVTSPAPGDGKTTVALNLALTLVQRGRRVLLLDADLRRGRIHGAIGAAREPGLSEVLLGEIPPAAAIRHVVVDQGITLDVLTSGRPMANAAPLLGGTQLRTLLERFASDYDLLVLDTPPLNVVSDAITLAASADGVILVARAGATNSGALGFAMDQLAHVKATLLGTVLNDVDFDRDVGYDSSYRYYRYDPTYYSESR